jgi:hypothetical protein
MSYSIKELSDINILTEEGKLLLFAIEQIQYYSEQLQKYTGKGIKNPEQILQELIEIYNYIYDQE